MALEISPSPSEDTLTQREWNGAIKIAIVINIIFFFCTYIHITNCMYTCRIKFGNQRHQKRYFDILFFCRRLQCNTL